MQTEPPKLPPMQQPASSPPPLSATGPVMPDRSQKIAGGNRLQKMVSVVAGGGFAVAVLICVGELTLRPELKPTTLAATIEAQIELGILNQRLGAAPGSMILTEDEYRSKIAEAERAGQAKAEIEYQRELAVVQADKERVVGAYQTLYQRANIIAQGAVQMEAAAREFRQRLIEQTNGGRAVVISVLDGLCAFGDVASCDQARRARAGMIEESAALTEGDMAAKVNELMAGIPDPASWVTNNDGRENGTPAIER